MRHQDGLTHRMRVHPTIRAWPSSDSGEGLVETKWRIRKPLVPAPISAPYNRRVGSFGRYALAVAPVALAIVALELLGRTVNGTTAAQVLLLVLIIDARFFGTGPAIVASLFARAHNDYDAFILWLRTPFTTVLMVLLLIALFHHMALGLRVVVEDYVHSDRIKIPTVVTIRFACFALVGAGIYATLRIALVD